jgi:cytochrome c oxidase subunit 4
MGHGTGQGTTHEHHIIPFATYLKVFISLLVLTVITVAAARVDFGALNAVVAFAIASVKAGLVLAIFMHLKYDDKLNRVIIGSSVFFLIILWIFCILDIFTRVGHSSTL